jgi:hypothetical protein
MIYAINADTLGISEYDFRDVRLGVVGDKTVALAETGLYEQCGDTDTGFCISAYVETGNMELLSPAQWKTLSRIYVANPDPMKASFVALGREEYSIGPFDVPGSKTGYNVGHTVRLPRSKKGQYWRVKIENVEGGRLELQSVSLGVETTHTVL